MEKLSSGAEQLLKEIIEHRFEEGSCDLKYWEHKFVVLDLDFAQDELIRSQFGTLEDRKMIAVSWGDNVPCELVVLDAGFAYYEKYLNKQSQGVRDVNVFISYNQKTGSQFADAVEAKLAGKANVIRDTKNIPSWGSISAFMESIREQDFAVAVITDEYLKSQACMYEIATMIRESDWKGRLIPAVLDSAIYGNKLQYVEYWSLKKKELEEKCKQDVLVIQALGKDAEQISRISSEINTFLTFVLDGKNPPIYTVLDEIEKRVLESSCAGSIPQNIKEKTGLAQIREKLSKVAEGLLVKAKQVQKKIMFGCDLSGYYLGLDGEDQEFASHSEDRRVAEWKEAIEQLVNLQLITQIDKKGQIFQLTSKGYRIADKIEIELMLEQ